MDWVFVALGLIILLLAGDALVKGAVNLSLRLGIPALIVSLTVVAFGTSAPELLVSVSAIHEGVPGLALGNVIGSNTANILLVLGLPAVMAPIATGHCKTAKTYWFMIIATLLFIGVAFLGPITWVHGTIFLAALTFVLGDAFRDAKRHRSAEKAALACAPVNDEEIEGADPDMPMWRVAMFLLLGLIGLPFGANILVDSSVNIARDFGVSETAIGLTLVAAGTSLPELATSVMAAFRREADVVLGNVIGSNIFNLLAIIGISSFVGRIPVSPEILRFDVWVMLGASLLLAPFVLWGWHLTRVWGAVLSVLYVIYVIAVLG